MKYCKNLSAHVYLDKGTQKRNDFICNLNLQNILYINYISMKKLKSKNLRQKWPYKWMEYCRKWLKLNCGFKKIHLDSNNKDKKLEKLKYFNCESKIKRTIFKVKHTFYNFVRKHFTQTPQHFRLVNWFLFNIPSTHLILEITFLIHTSNMFQDFVFMVWTLNNKNHLHSSMKKREEHEHCVSTVKHLELCCFASTV